MSFSEPPPAPAPVEAPSPPAGYEFIGAPPEAAPPKPRRSRKPLVIVVIVLLFLALVAAVIALVIYLGKLDDANARIQEQKTQLKEQQELIDKKETFGAAMEGLLDTAGQFDGVLTASIVPFDSYGVMASRAYIHRWDADKVEHETEAVGLAVAELETLLSAASAQAGTNSSGSSFETEIDSLGAGFVTSIVDNNADSTCGSDVLGCVFDADPYTVHFDAADGSLPYMGDFQRRGIAYHEFAHVLQMTNPEATEVAVASFDGDVETMADCFSLTYVDGWTLDQTIWMSRYEYWTVSFGYGYTCNDAQKQVIRDWYGQLGFHVSPIEQ